MTIPRWKSLRVTSEAVWPGTTVRYHHRDGDSIATVTERTARFITFVGEECDGKFTHEQIDRLIEDGRLEIVLGG